MTLQKPMRIETTVEPQEVREPATASLPQAESKDTPPSEEVETISQIPSPGKEAFLPVPPVHPSRQSAISPPEPPRGIELEITALEDTWIQIQIDLAPSREIFLRPHMDSDTDRSGTVERNILKTWRGLFEAGSKKH
jgi:hypothetical protein